MKHQDYFNNFLTNDVNLSKFRLETLEGQANAVYTALKTDSDLGPRVVKMIPQGSWAQKTIINPVNGREIDADFLVQLKEEPDWAFDPQRYNNAVYRALDNHSTYGGMPHGRKARCVYVRYANQTHVDVVPYIVLSDGRKVIVNRNPDKNCFENTNPEGFTAWMKEKDQVANRNLRKVIRLLKYLRDHKGSFNGVKSILLTTLLGEQVQSYKTNSDVSCYSDVPTTLLNVVTDLDGHMQMNFYKPSVADPSGSGVTFDHRWTQETYSNFRIRLHAIKAQIEDAYHEEDPEESVRKWQDLFGDKFQPPKTSASSSKFGTGAAAAGAAAATSTGRTGRAG